MQRECCRHCKRHHVHLADIIRQRLQELLRGVLVEGGRLLPVVLGAVWRRMRRRGCRGRAAVAAAPLLALQ